MFKTNSRSWAAKLQVQHGGLWTRPSSVGIPVLPEDTGILCLKWNTPRHTKSSGVKHWELSKLL